MADSGNAKVLKARVEFDVNSAEKKLDMLSKKINNLNKAFSNMGSGTDKLNSKLSSSNTQAKKLESTTKKVDRNIKTTVGSVKLVGNRLQYTTSLGERLNSVFSKTNYTITHLPTSMKGFISSIKLATTSARETEDVFDKIYRTIKGISATYFGLMGSQKLIDTSDMLTSAQNRLNDYNSQYLGAKGITTNANGGTDFSKQTLKATQTQMDKMFASAQRARVGYDDMMSNVSKSMVLAKDAFGDNMDNAIRFQEIMGKAYTLGGASAAEQASSMYQMIQALGAGILAGDELRSVREGAPMAYQAIEKFAQGVYNTEESLKDLASQGKITSDIVVAAMLDAGDSIDDRFSRTAMTFGQAFTMMKNTAIRAFKPVLEYMNKFLNSSKGKEMLNIINEIIVLASYGVAALVKGIETIITFIVDNWSWLKPLLVASITFIASMILFKIGGSILNLILLTARLIMTHPIIGMISLIAGLTMGLCVSIAEQSQNLHDFLVQLMFSIMIIALAVITIISVAIFIGTGGTVALLWLAAAVFIAVVALITWLWLQYTDKFMGSLYVIKAAFLNVCRFMGNLWLALGAVWNAALDNIVQAFKDAWLIIKRDFFDLVSSILSGMSTIIKALNPLLELLGLGTIDIDATIKGLDSKSEGYQKQLDANGKKYKNLQDTFDAAFNTYQYDNLDTAYRSGAEKGHYMQEKLKNMDLGGLITDLTGIDVNGFEIPDPNAAEYALNPDDLNSLLGNDALNDIAGSSGNTADNTKNISDSMNILDTDLKYLKELGEREAINKFTTAEIKVEMKNDNYISERVDMDGVVDYLSDRLYEELGVVANGVHY